MLLQDHLQEIPLQNGLSARLSVLAAVTFDLAGKIEVSMWNRASQAELDNRWVGVKGWRLRGKGLNKKTASHLEISRLMNYTL